MAVSLDATAKGASANTYITLADANTYMDGAPDDTDWDAAGTDAKNRALKSATDRLEQEDWHGSPTTTTQRLRWPRFATYDRDGTSLDSDTIPRAIEEATVELANAIIKGEYETADTGLEGFKHVKVGPLDVTPNHAREAATLPETVQMLIAHLRQGGSSGLSAHIVRS